MSQPPFAKKLPTLNLFVTTRKVEGRKHFTGFAYLADESGKGHGEYLGEARGVLPFIVEPKTTSGRPKGTIENITFLAHYDFVMTRSPNLSPSEARNEAMRIITDDATFSEIDQFGGADRARGLQKQLQKARKEIEGFYTGWITDPERPLFYLWLALERMPQMSSDEVVVESDGWSCRIGENASFGHIKARYSTKNIK